MLTYHSLKGSQHARKLVGWMSGRDLRPLSWQPFGKDSVIGKPSTNQLTLFEKRAGFAARLVAGS